MLDHIHVTDKPSQIGFYSGIIDSIFAVAQFVSLYEFGKLSGSSSPARTEVLRLTRVVIIQTDADESRSSFWRSSASRSARSRSDSRKRSS